MKFLIPALVVSVSLVALVAPATRRGRMRSLRWVVGPLVVVGLGVNWILMALGSGIQENCEPDCLTATDAVVAAILFGGGTAAWLFAVVATARHRG